MVDAVDIKQVKKLFEDAGYKVGYAPQEKLAEGEITLRLSNIELTIEDGYLYFLPCTLAIEFQQTDPSVISGKIRAIVKLVEEGLHSANPDLLRRGTVKFTSATIVQPGELYRVTLNMMYTEEIAIDK